MSKCASDKANVKRQYNGGHRRAALVRQDRKLRQSGCSVVFGLRAQRPARCALVFARGLGQRSGASKKTDDIEFLSKPQLALEFIIRAKANGARVSTWTADGLYGRNPDFMNGLDDMSEAFVVEIPTDFRVWLRNPIVFNAPPNGGRVTRGPAPKYLRLKLHEQKPCKVRNLARYSPELRDQTQQRYRIKDSPRGPDVREICWTTWWRQAQDERFVSSQCTLIVARTVLADEVAYFLSNRVPVRGGWTLQKPV